MIKSQRIITGSQVFFTGMEGFKPKDLDVIQLVDKHDVNFLFRRAMVDHEEGCDIFYVVRQPKENYLSWAELHASPMTLGQFLTPAFCQEVGITVADLPRLRRLRDHLDSRHQYLGIIYDAYIENKSMTLTEEQRRHAFSEYKEERDLI